MRLRPVHKWEGEASAMSWRNHRGMRITPLLPVEASSTLQSGHWFGCDRPTTSTMHGQSLLALRGGRDMAEATMSTRLPARSGRHSACGGHPPPKGPNGKKHMC